jgi:hypothetical protein
MRSVSIFHFGIILFFSIVSINAHAEIDHRKLKGIHGMLRPEYQFLSPIYGFSVLKKGILENLYRYGPDEDKTVKLIKLIFHSIDRTSFGATCLPSNVATHLDTSAIGSLLRNSLHLAEGSVMLDHEPRFLSAVQNGIGLEENDSGMNRFKAKQKQILRKKSKEFVKILLGAFEETLGQDRKYPEHFVEHILLGLFWSKAKNEKSEFLQLLVEIPHAVNYENTDLPASALHNSACVENDYESDDYKRAVIRFEKSKSSDHFIACLLGDPELSAYLAYSYQIWGDYLPPVIDYGNVNFTLQDGGVEEFADCGETSLRNFFNIVLKNQNTQKLDASFLRDLAANRNLKVSPELIEFYERNTSLSNLEASELHDQWAKVVSGLSEVGYLQPRADSVCNITGGLESVLTVFNALIFSNDSDFEELSNIKKLNLLVETFSRPEFKLTWDLVDDDSSKVTRANIGFTVRFYINGIPQFTWQFSRGHFEVASLGSTRSDWRMELSIPLFKEFAKTNNSLVTKNPGFNKSLSCLSWFTFEGSLESLISELRSSSLSKADLQFLIWSLTLNREAAKLDTIATIISNRWDNLYPLAVKLAQDLIISPNTDLHLVEQTVDRLNGLSADFKVFLKTIAMD